MTTSPVSIVAGADGIISIQGALRLVTMEQALQQGNKVFNELSGDLMIDLAGVNRTDSAGLALLIHWMRKARAASRHLSYIHPPAHLLKLAESSNLGDILPFIPAVPKNFEQ